MDYKNLLLRSVFSILILIIYLIISLNNFSLTFYLILLIYLFVFTEIFIYFKNFKIIPLIYTFTSFLFFVIINFDKSIYINFNLFIFTIVTFDVFSYLIGKIIGRNKLIRLSPNKTIEGFLGGLFLSFFLTNLFAFILGLTIDIQLIGFIFLFILSAFVGDIIESYFKRKNNLKNSSEFIPGHGGVFDRFDSFLFSIVIYSVSINF